MGFCNKPLYVDLTAAAHLWSKAWFLEAPVVLEPQVLFTALTYYRSVFIFLLCITPLLFHLFIFPPFLQKQQLPRAKYQNRSCHPIFNFFPMYKMRSCFLVLWLPLHTPQNVLYKNRLFVFPTVLTAVAPTCFGNQAIQVWIDTKRSPGSNFPLHHSGDRIFPNYSLWYWLLKYFYLPCLPPPSGNI